MLDEFGAAIDTRISEWKVPLKFNKLFRLEDKHVFIQIFIIYIIRAYWMKKTWKLHG